MRATTRIAITVRYTSHEGSIATFTVESFGGGDPYVVRYHTQTRHTRCTCRDDFFRHAMEGGRCKHGELVAQLVKTAGGIAKVPPQVSVEVEHTGRAKRGDRHDDAAVHP